MTPGGPARTGWKRERATVDTLRKLCSSFPEANERRSHGEPTWFAGKGKVFAMLDDHHHGAPHLSVWLPMPPGVQESLVSAEPTRFFRPPYVGSAGWVGVVLDTEPDWPLVSKVLREAFLHVAGARLRAELLSGPHTQGTTRPPRGFVARRRSRSRTK